MCRSILKYDTSFLTSIDVNDSPMCVLERFMCVTDGVSLIFSLRK